MRQHLGILLLALGAGCGFDRGTGPTVMTIRVRLHDDAGATAGRNQVILSDAASTLGKGSTRSDGTVEFKVAQSGSYWVQVVPRSDYLASAALRKEVTIAAPGNAVVEFTLYRAAGSTIEFPTEGTPP